MGRKKTIDRDRVLDVAELLVSQKGAASLTFDSIAQAAGISKGGVQSCFASKEILIESLLMRWIAQYESRISELRADQATPMSAVEAHIANTFGEDELAGARTAALLAALLQSPHHLGGIIGWYEKRIQEIERIPVEARGRVLLGFLATEGFFFLKNFGLVNTGSLDAGDIARDIFELLAGPKRDSENGKHRAAASVRRKAEG